MSEKTKPEKKSDLNYNERPDGYGFGEAESESHEHEYEKDRDKKKKPEASTKDEHGMPNQQGEVDQYNFRDT